MAWLVGILMTNKITWSNEADGAILRLRAAGIPWHKLAAELRVGRNSVIERARRLGLPAVKIDRPPSLQCKAVRDDRLPLGAGHPISWSVITDGTVLQGSPYPYPVFL